VGRLPYDSVSAAPPGPKRREDGEIAEEKQSDKIDMVVALAEAALGAVKVGQVGIWRGLREFHRDEAIRTVAAHSPVNAVVMNFGMRRTGGGYRVMSVRRDARPV
jgi:hypothetical protein